jgi:hypothetical protein
MKNCWNELVPAQKGTSTYRGLADNKMRICQLSQIFNSQFLIFNLRSVLSLPAPASNFISVRHRSYLCF